MYRQFCKRFTKFATRYYNALQFTGYVARDMLHSVNWMRNTIRVRREMRGQF